MISSPSTPGSDWASGGLFLVGLLALMATTQVVSSTFHWPPAHSRKVIHLATGFIVALAPMVFSTPPPLLLLSLVFIVLNFIGARYRLIRSMHGVSEGSGGEAVSYGTVYYPMAFFILVAWLWDGGKSILVIAMLILAVADAGAALVGERAKNPIGYRIGSDAKSLQGSLAMFGLSAAVVFITLPWLDSLDGLRVRWFTAAWMAVAVGLYATALEAVSYRGSDNLTVPLGAAFILHFLLSHPTAVNLLLLTGMALSLVIGVISIRARFLDLGGAVGLFLLGTIIFGLGGFTWSVPILAFFFLSSYLSKLGRERKSGFSEFFQKSSTRDFHQVMANGGAAGVVVLLAYFFPNDFWFVLYLGTLAAATADTWSTEIGLLSKPAWGGPWSIVTFRKVAPGTSGGVSLLGTTGGLLGAATVAGIGWLAQPRLPWVVAVVVTVTGFAGSLLDSVLGATIQAQRQCRACGKLTERIIHCNEEPTTFVSGWRWVNNDVVNGACAFFGVLVAWLGVQVVK